MNADFLGAAVAGAGPAAGSMRQREAIQAENQGDQTGDAQDLQLFGLADQVEEGFEERGRLAAEVEIPAHQEGGQEPADRSPEADRREQAGVFFAQGSEGQRIGQADRGEVEACNRPASAGKSARRW